MVCPMCCCCVIYHIQKLIEVQGFIFRLPFFSWECGDCLHAQKNFLPLPNLHKDKCNFLNIKVAIKGWVTRESPCGLMRVRTTAKKRQVIHVERPGCPVPRNTNFSYWHWNWIPFHTQGQQESTGVISCLFFK